MRLLLVLLLIAGVVWGSGYVEGKEAHVMLDGDENRPVPQGQASVYGDKADADSKVVKGVKLRKRCKEKPVIW